MRFVTHAARTLQLANVAHAAGAGRDLCLDAPYDTVLARAYAALPDLVAAFRAVRSGHARGGAQGTLSGG